MKVVVLGSGVVGTTTAYYLAKAGAEVVVIDRQSDPAMETSYANAGQVSPGYSTPWAAPGIPFKAFKWLFQKHAPLSIRPDGSLFQLQWMLSMLSNCSADNYAINKERMMRLSEYSRDCLKQLRIDSGVSYEERSKGTLQLFRTTSQVESAQRDIQVLEECGVPYELLAPDDLQTVEPALAKVKHKLTGGLRLPNDETGDCHLFTNRLADKAKALGVKFIFDTDITDVRVDGQKILAVVAGSQLITADKFVLAFGSFSRFFMQRLGVSIPVYPLKGYSLTIPMVNESCAPVSTILDETYKIAVTRFDNRIRVGGMAEIAGYNLKLNPRRKETLLKVVTDLFPGSGNVDQAEFWTGLRPMTPDGTPIVGASNLTNLFLNTGHGTLGWTMACGSGKLVSDLVIGNKPDIKHTDLAISRYNGSAVSHASDKSIQVAA